MAISVISILDAQDIEAELQRAAGVLAGGGLVVLPTETVYAVAGRIDRPDTLKRLQAHRGNSDPAAWTIHLARPEQVADYVGERSLFVERLVNKLWPGPVGLVIPVPEARRAEVAKRLGVHESAIFENGAITLRCPDHPVFADVAERSNAPIVMTRLTDVSSQFPENIEVFGGDIDLAINAGPTRYSKPSTLLRVHDDRYEVVRTGVFDERIIERLLRTLVLFVCSGNTCRSPMAEALTRKIIAESLGTTEQQLEMRGYAVASAGVFALPGTRATPQAVEAVHDLGADLTRHRSQPLTPELLHMADVVYAMGAQHGRAIQMMSSAAANKLRPLDREGDIEDPIGSDVATYLALAQKMESLIRIRLKEDKIIT